jgi:hypothetical protein
MEDLGIPKSSLPGLIDDYLSRQRLQLIHDIMPILAANEQPTKLTFLANDELMLGIVRCSRLPHQFRRRAI